MLGPPHLSRGLFHQRIELAKKQTTLDLVVEVTLFSQLPLDVRNGCAPAGFRQFKCPLQLGKTILH
jgi:hypothetical protein